MHAELHVSKFRYAPVGAWILYIDLHMHMQLCCVRTDMGAAAYICQPLRVYIKPVHLYTSSYCANKSLAARMAMYGCKKYTKVNISSLGVYYGLTCVVAV